LTAKSEQKMGKSNVKGSEPASGAAFERKAASPEIKNNQTNQKGRGGRRKGAGRPKKVSVVLELSHNMAEELRAEPDTKKRWQKLRNAKDERLRFAVERYIWDRADGTPARQAYAFSPAATPRPITLGNLPMPTQ
jgi:hypothetical protein